MSGVDNIVLRDEDSIILDLKELYERSGYRAFKIRNFEEYSLYIENKNFLSSEQIITFNDQNGRLLALKPDVTLSIVKNTKATENASEKLYYREGVYRFDKHSHEYKEINQVGLEMLGKVDYVSELEICMLALKSLSVIDSHYKLQISHLGFITGFMDSIGITSVAKKKELLSYFAEKNLHDLRKFASDSGVSAGDTERLVSLASVAGSFEDVSQTLKELVLSEDMQSAYDEMKSILCGIEALGMGDSVVVDFSGVSDIDYYNGIVFKGYIRGLSHSVLSGGRYDRLARKFNSKVQAIGFAVYLGQIAYYQKSREYDADVLIVYSDKSSPAEVEAEAERLRKSGKSVRTEPEEVEGMSFREIIRM